MVNTAFTRNTPGNRAFSLYVSNLSKPVVEEKTYRCYECGSKEILVDWEAKDRWGLSVAPATCKWCRSTGDERDFVSQP